MSRTLTSKPLVEHIFEIKWSHPGGPEQLINEYQLALGQLFSNYSETHRREALLGPPIELMKFIMPEGLIRDRFHPLTTPDGQIGYPLYQYGPGIASFNVNKEHYSWNGVLKSSADFYKHLCEAHKDLNNRISSISIRSLDLFSTDDVSNFLENKFDITIKTPLDSLSSLYLEESVPIYSETWGIRDFPGKMRIQAAPGVAGEASGVLLDILVAIEQPRMDAFENFESLLQKMHKVCGDAFFALLNESLRTELGYHE